MRGEVVVLTLAALAGCGGEGDSAPAAEDGAEVATALATVADNPCDARLTTRADPSDTVVARVLTGTLDLANEAHDCQRLLVDGGEAFGPLVGLFPMDETLGLARADFATPRPAVTVYSWGAADGSYPAEYAPLGIGEGAHCLWLRNATGAPDGWSAALGRGVCGADPPAPAEGDFRLAVFERTYPDAAGEDYPRTARWEWDLVSGRQLIGVRCGEAWCAVLPAGSTAPRTRPLPEPLRGSEMPRLAVPGWSDAQRLAVFDSAAGRVRPGPWAAVLSHPPMHEESPPWTEGILAAAIEVEDDGSAAYGRLAERFYLQPGDGGGRSDVILRFPGISPDEAWYQQGPMRRRQAAGVSYAPALENPARGAVRWRWREGEPELWMFCRGGSCGVEG